MYFCQGQHKTKLKKHTDPGFKFSNFLNYFAITAFHGKLSSYHLIHHICNDMLGSLAAENLYKHCYLLVTKHCVSVQTWISGKKEDVKRQMQKAEGKVQTNSATENRVHAIMSFEGHGFHCWASWQVSTYFPINLASESLFSAHLHG